VELLVLAAARLIFGPILGRVWADVQQAAADNVEGVVKAWWWRRSRVPDPELSAGSDSPQPTEVPVPAEASDAEIASAMDGDQPKAEEFRRVLEEMLGVDLSEASAGTDDTILSAYQALMWRAAVMTGWERRPIALAGSLLGPDWVTVCQPTVGFKKGSVVDPSSLWETNEHGDLIRSADPRPPVEFYLRRFPDRQAATSAADTLNQAFARSHDFKAGPPGPLGDAWHRVDGLNRGWVRLQWDDVVNEHVKAQRSQRHMFMHNDELRLRPPVFDEFPKDWQEAMGITDPAAAIETLRDALDAYAEASAESLAAARAALKG
jgi:hypothetical protein